MRFLTIPNPTVAPTAASDTRSLFVLCLGASVGLLFAVAVLLFDSPQSVPDATVVATVNGTPLHSADFERAVRRFSSEKRSPATPADRALILERMIEEVLLLQYGIETGLVRDNPAVRGEVLRAVMRSLLVDAEAGAGGGGGDPGRETASNDRVAAYLAQLRAGARIRRPTSGRAQ